MIKKILTLTFSLILYSAYSQKDSINVYQLEYLRKLTFEDTPTNPYISSYEYIKFIELNKSIYKKIKKNKNSDILKRDKNQATVVDFYPSGKNISTVFKNYGKNEFYSKHEVAYKYFVVKDKLNIFNWSVLNNTKEILGYNCQLATMDYRGRKYEAWFTTDLPIGGPWKYDGLPGMILEIKSKDNFIAFKATGIKNIVIELVNIKNPFNLKKAITWAEFKALYKRKSMELIDYRPDESFIGVESSRGGIELYIDKDDKEYNNALKKLPKSNKN
ncbi:GLPGLI family protein [Polaribacter sp. PL03]|uniref:GLPGLI family protein n=1 Tax=Polaribacter sp. PL03 TaxID=3088353 RepID=UPI0029D397D2|nr:GLPGLI family protein [Polaribacter sp. PL03]MDX6747537.1 GLPGLI family protein [Polaribacter sp. PL03]